MQAHIWFQRKEEFEERTTPRESPFRKFIVTCLKCGSARLKLVVQYDEDNGETAMILYCPSCRSTERLRPG